MKKVFKTNDLIVSMLKFPNPCPIRIEITDKYVFLYVGARDWQWRLSDSSMVGAGTGCCQPIVDTAEPVTPPDGEPLVS